MIDIHAPFKERAEWVLSRTFRGFHYTTLDSVYWEDNYCSYNTVPALATYDDDELTRLVIAAHDACVRAWITHSGPYMAKIHLGDRKGREGLINERHPTIEQAIETMRAGE